MGCGLSKYKSKIQSSTAVEIFNEDQAKSIIGVSVIKLTYNGKSFKLYYKQLSD